MKKLQNVKYGEFWTYFVLWFVMFASPMVSISARASIDSSFTFHWQAVYNIWRPIFVLFVVFLIHNFLIAPLLFRKRSISAYLAASFLLIISFQTYQCTYHPEDVPPPEFVEQMKASGSTNQGMEGSQGTVNPRPMPDDRPPRPPIDIHDIMAFTIMLLILGVNVGVKYFFYSIEKTRKLEELEKESLEQRLEYLKYQINPHFFMNTLNNIHALVDIDPENAKNSILELSKLMRYLLYESNKHIVPLAREVEFLQNYVELMRMRYPEKVAINLNIPSSIPDHQVPPLIFISFAENAFKHGVSYKQESKIDIAITVSDEEVAFSCANNKVTASDAPEKGGIGIENTLKRLDIIYGKNYSLNITDTEEDYRVNLSVPFLKEASNIENKSK